MKRSTMIGVVTCALMQIVVVSTGFASEARVAALGGRGIWIHDDSNIGLFPGTLLAYPDRAISELRVKDPTHSRHTFGFHVEATETSVLGVYLNKPLSIPVFLDTDGDYFSPTDPLLRAGFEKTLSVFYGIRMDDTNLTGGLTLGLDGFSTEVRGGKSEESTRYILLSAGLSQDMLDLGLGLELPGLKQESRNHEYTWSGLGIKLAGRAFLGDDDGFTIVPVGQLSLSPTKAELRHEGELYKADLSEMSLFLGVGLTKMLSERNLLILGLEAIGMSRVRLEDTVDKAVAIESVTTLPGIYLGIESEIRPWLVGRVGAAERFRTTKQSVEMMLPGVPDAEISERSSDLDITFGLGLRFGRFTLDAVLNDNILFDGPNFISGTEESMSNRLSVTYAFN